MVEIDAMKETRPASSSDNVNSTDEKLEEAGRGGSVVGRVLSRKVFHLSRFPTPSGDLWTIDDSNELEKST